MASQPTFASPIVAGPGADGPLTLTDLSYTHKTLVRSDHELFGVAFGANALSNGVLVCGTRPTEWVLLGSAQQNAAVVAAAGLSGHSHAIDFTHGRALVQLRGADAAKVLEKVCSIDWSEDMTPNGAVVSASVAKVSCDIIRRDGGGKPAYLLMFDRSYGQYLFDALLDAGTEFGLTVTSPQT